VFGPSFAHDPANDDAPSCNPENRLRAKP
jgi:hypothetical protein